MIGKLLNILIESDFEEPKYILLYHAIDFIAGIIAKPLPYYQHDYCYLNIASQFNQDRLNRLRNAAIAKLNSVLLSDKIKLYGKPFEASFIQVSDNKPNNIQNSLDYPAFTFDRKLEKITKLPNVEYDLVIEDTDIFRVFSPYSHDLIKLSKAVHNELEFIGFDFGYLDSEHQNFYVLDKFGITSLAQFNSWKEGDVTALLFLKVEEIQRIFFANDKIHPLTNRGRPKKHYAEISLLKFVSHPDQKLNQTQKNKLNAFFEEIDFFNLWEQYQRAGAIERSFIIEKLGDENQTLIGLINQLKKLEIGIEVLFDIQTKSFVNFLNEIEGMAKDRMLQKHFSEIKANL